MSGLTCPNCAAEMRGSPCSVCGYRRQKPGRYPIGHDPLTDSYLVPERDVLRGESVEPDPPRSTGLSAEHATGIRP